MHQRRWFPVAALDLRQLAQFYLHSPVQSSEILTILKPKVSGSSNVVVKHVTARDTWGEGFYVGGDSISNNITLCSITADNNRRNRAYPVVALSEPERPGQASC